MNRRGKENQHVLPTLWGSHRSQREARSLSRPPLHERRLPSGFYHSRRAPAAAPRPPLRPNPRPSRRGIAPFPYGRRRRGFNTHARPRRAFRSYGEHARGSRRAAVPASRGCSMTGSVPMDATRAGGLRICGCLDFLSSENVGSHAKENRAGDAATRRAQVELPFFSCRQEIRGEKGRHFLAAGGTSDGRSCAPLPAGRKLGGETSLFFLPVGNWIRFYLTLYQ